MLVAVFENIWL